MLVKGATAVRLTPLCTVKAADKVNTKFTADMQWDMYLVDNISNITQFILYEHNHSIMIYDDAYLVRPLLFSSYMGKNGDDHAE